MWRSQQLVEQLQVVINSDVQLGDYSVVNHFLNNNLKGGWEGWLQVTYALAILRKTRESNQAADIAFNREVTYSATSTTRCDLWVQAGKGTSIYVELKTQRTSFYTDTVAEFAKDIQKQRDQSPEGVCLAAAVLKVGQAEASDLNKLKQQTGIFKYFHRTPDGQWSDVTDQIASLTTGNGELLLATWRWTD